MDRAIIYPGAVPLETDLLFPQVATLQALGALIGATLGTTTVADGLWATPTSPASMSLVIGQGCLTAFGVTDAAGFSSLGTNGDGIVRMGINVEPVTIGPFAAAPSPGQACNVLIQGAFAETDANPALLPYLNAANPALPFGGPGNNGVAQPTRRLQRVALSARPGTPATAGLQGTPVADSGCVPLYVVTIPYGTAALGAGNIAIHPAAPFIPFKLPQLAPGFSNIRAFTASGSWTVPNGVTRIRVTVVGGGGQGGGGTDAPIALGSGGGAGGTAVGVFAVTPGSTWPVTVGAGGYNPTAGTDGSNGGASSFGALISATGGAGGKCGTAPVGGNGGICAGGNYNCIGGDGLDAIVINDGNGNYGGTGGGTPFGTSNRSSRQLTGGQAPGVGGAGAPQGIRGVGSGGANGLVIVEW
ncbi:conserved protein of unknown function [Rhodovastum atsumiense]|uniref:Glycine-rich domain-containing protein n=1 Tax=Rhodovastum atsumiense TaxID=504468 RepID=A0A5M6J1G4_9PROT|nr:hypothetical protein [Rhodovastum atsumiense]KAA5613488.1 hypothetical protein F1189_05380 [Rhodovastum atsumiense]CAH2603232.1 conserved protein of unknown function [Rhodovastum atsumiense]